MLKFLFQSFDQEEKDMDRLHIKMNKIKGKKLSWEELEEIYFRNQANLRLVRLIEDCDRRNWKQE